MKEEYQCKKCHDKFEQEVKTCCASCAPEMTCPKCGSKDVENLTEAEQVLHELLSMRGYGG